MGGKQLGKIQSLSGFLDRGVGKGYSRFLVKIRKRRERIHSKGLLEKSKFERELNRLECSINYEGEKKQKAPLQGRECQLSEVQ